MREDVDGRAARREPAQDRALAAVVDDRDAHAPVGREGVRLVGRDAARRAPRPPSPAARAPPSSTSSTSRRSLTTAARIAPRSRRCRTSERVSTPVSADDAVLVQPVRPLRAARLAHHDRRRVRAARLGARVGDAVVADHRRGEADELALEARVGRDLLVAGHRRS